MKPAFTTLILTLLLTYNAKAQNDKGQESEFKQHSNGFIYDQATMYKLKAIVEKENLKYKRCELWKDYYIIPQGICHFVRLDTGNIEGAKSDMDNNIGFEEFRKKYPLALIEESRVFIKHIPKTHEGVKTTQYDLAELDSGTQESMFANDSSFYDKKQPGNWLYWYHEKDDRFYKNGKITAFYIVSETAERRLPIAYEKMIQYADCLIDTNGTIFFSNKQKGFMFEEEEDKPLPKRKLLNVFVEKKVPKPDRKAYDDRGKFFDAKYRWSITKDSIMVARYKNDPTFISKVKQAVEEGITDTSSDEELEYYAEKLGLKTKALSLKRSRRVTGGCSEDLAPREHALAIAKLAAETTSWDIFLRAHLDIMNDNFFRMTDGSYAYGSRKTYVKELEELNIDVTTLLLGISLRIGNPSGHHYFGSISRLGRAISESRNAKQFEVAIAHMIEDTSLDDYNRIAAFYLFKTYNYYLENKTRKSESFAVLEKAAASLPPYILSRVKLKYEEN